MLNFSYLKKYKKNILITAGDFDGIGSEIIAKALKKIKLPSKTSITVFLSSKDIMFRRFYISSKSIYVFYFDLDPQKIVSYAAELCVKKKFNSLVNGPMSKGPYKKFKSAGHTEILSEVSGKHLTPVFLGSQFNIVLATSHKPLFEAANIYKKIDISYFLKLSKKINALTFKTKKHPVVFLGLNPHAGENGLIGIEEIFLQRKFSKLKFHSADGFFSQSKNFLNKSIVAAYHDQGLIPFKMAHQNGKAVQISYGLPFLRVTVCHGTAKQIYGKNIAKFDSMLEAIKLAIKHK